MSPSSGQERKVKRHIAKKQQQRAGLVVRERSGWNPASNLTP